jgi:hypothetical protein
VQQLFVLEVALRFLLQRAQIMLINGRKIVLQSLAQLLLLIAQPQLVLIFAK